MEEEGGGGTKLEPTCIDQTIENKQKFISQIMTSKTPVRVAEDVDESSLNYAEIKALATGDPKIKEKMDLDNEVTKLKMLEANYKSNRYRLEDKVAKNYPEEIARTEKLIEAVKKDISDVEPKAEGEEKFTSITIAGEKITDKKLAGERLLEAIKTVKLNESKVIGKYRNMDLEVSYNFFTNEHNFSLNGAAKHSGELGTSADGNITRLDNVLEKMQEKLSRLEEKLISTKEQLENAKEELKKPFEKADELKSKVLRLAELNKLLDMGEVEEKRNDNPLVEDVKRAIIDFCNREYEENHSYDEFNTLYPDLKHIGIAYTNTPDERHGIQYELDLEEKTWTQYIDDMPIKTESFDYENKGENEALRNIKNEIEMSSFSDLVYVDSEDLRAATGLDIDDEGNFYDPLSKDLDNDGIPDRYDNDFKDSDFPIINYIVDGGIIYSNVGPFLVYILESFTITVLFTIFISMFVNAMYTATNKLFTILISIIAFIVPFTALKYMGVIGSFIPFNYVDSGFVTTEFLSALIRQNSYTMVMAVVVLVISSILFYVLGRVSFGRRK